MEHEVSAGTKRFRCAHRNLDALHSNGLIYDCWDILADMTSQWRQEEWMANNFVCAKCLFHEERERKTPTCICCFSMTKTTYPLLLWLSLPIPLELTGLRSPCEQLERSRVHQQIFDTNVQVHAIARWIPCCENRDPSIEFQSVGAEIGW